MKQTIIFLFVILHCLFRANASSHPGTGDFSLSTTRFYQKNDITRAERYLNGLENDSRALNNRALLEILRGATDKGVLLLKKAGLQGNENACFNMEEYTKYEQREQERKKITQKNESNHEEL